jgi:hypothetical protein
VAPEISKHEIQIRQRVFGHMLFEQHQEARRVEFTEPNTTLDVLKQYQYMWLPCLEEVDELTNATHTGFGYSKPLYV